MSADKASLCVTGKPAEENGRCVAKYELPCAFRTFKVFIKPHPADAYATYKIDRFVSRDEPWRHEHNRDSCQQTLNGLSAIGNATFGDADRLKITVFGEKQIKACEIHIALNAPDLANGPKEYECKYERPETARGRISPTDNTRDLHDERDKITLTKVTIEFERVMVR
jgi:hypothetical protein